MFTPDGESIYFTHATTPGNIFQYAENSDAELFAIDRYDIETGERTKVAGGPGGAVRPTPSPDGRWLVYVKRDRARSKLSIQDLKTGEERKIYDDIEQDMNETEGVKGGCTHKDRRPQS